MDEADRIIGIYRRHASAFDGKRSRVLFERRWLDAFCAGLPAGSEILDAGCGAGAPMATHLASRGFRVTGIDTSPPLLALARERLPDHTWIMGDLRSFDLGRRFDGILAWDSLFHLRDREQREVLSRFAAHTGAGGMLLFTSGPAAGEAIGEFEGEPLYHASLSPDDYRELLARHGFAVVDHVAEDATCGGHTVWLARKTAAPGS